MEAVPEINEEVDGYTLRWAEQHVTIKVSRLNIHKDGRVSGEISINTDKEGFTPVLMPPTSINFAAERTRTSLAKSLTDKFGEDFEWVGIIDQLAYYVQEMARKGEPIQELWTSDEVKAPEYLLEPFIWKDLPNVIYGEKGANKSTLAIVFYACLIMPWYDNPLGLKVITQDSIPTLILDWETEGNIAQYYSKLLQDGMGLPPYPVVYRRCSLPLADDLEQIQAHINSRQIKVVIIDSIGAAAGGDLKSADIALRFFTALRRLKVTSLLIGQTTKDEDTRRKRLFGSTFFEYYSRNLWEIVKSGSAEEGTYNIALFHRSPNLSALHDPVGFQLCFNGAKLSVERQAVNYAEFINKITAKQQILEHLKAEGLKTAKEIVDDLGITRGSVDMALKRLRERDIIVKVDNKWGLKSNVY